MKRILLQLTFVLALLFSVTGVSTNVLAQCDNTLNFGAYGSAVAPAVPLGTATITCQYAGEYGTWSSVVAGVSYTMTSTVASDWCTVRSLTPSGAVVAFGAQPLTFTAPVSGTYYIHWNTNNACGTQASCRNVTMTMNAPPPTIASFTPASGCGQAVSVVITGTNFTGASAVTFGGTNALSFVVNSATQITAIPNNAATGTIAVTTAGGTATSAGVFTVTASPAAPTPVTATPATICVGSSSNLVGTSAGNTITWFTVPSGGVAVGTSASGANFPVTPAATTIYYAETTPPGGAGTQTFNYTGAVQTFTVPAGVTSLSVDVRGAKGGGCYPAGSLGGNGGRVTGTLSVTGGQVLNIYVGGAGGNGAVAVAGAGGFNGGGLSGLYSGSYSGGGGGGASDIRVSPYALANRVAIAGGGGGAGFDCANEVGGLGGGLTGGDGQRCGAIGAGAGGTGLGGSQVAGGLAIAYPGWCVGVDGALGVGGNGGPCTNAGGGGGGGYYGGGGGAWGSGGGGSSFLAGGVHTQGFQTGNGQVILTWSLPPACPSPTRTPVTVIVNAIAAAPSPVTATPATICEGATSQLNSTGAVGSTQTWYTQLAGGVAIGTSLSGANFPVTPAVTTTYYVETTSLLPGGSQTFNYTGAVQNFTVPAGVTTITMDVRGAQGGTYVAATGGLGARMVGDVAVTPGQVLSVWVGQQGVASQNAGGGGGASGVTNGATALVIAGAGGGGCSVNLEVGKPGLTTTTGGNSSGAGGAAGNGGQKGYMSGDCGWAGGGGGFLGDGYGGPSGGDGGALPGTLGGPAGGKSRPNGGAGGIGGSCGFSALGAGGWGCGGGGRAEYGGGGGGGYSGGGGGQYTAPAGSKSGGGGGSFNSGVNQSNTQGFQSGNGQVILTWAAIATCPSTPRIPVTVVVNPLSPTPTPVTATPAAICAGGTSQLNSTAAAGNVQSWYTVPSGGVAIGTSLSGANFPVTPAVTTTYYAESQALAPAGSQTFNFTGAAQTFTVPAGVTSITINALGAQGVGGGGFIPGNGGRAQGVMTVTPGQVLNVYVGGTNAFNGGGIGLGGSNGGGASDVRAGGVALADRVIVAGGGGGAGGDNWNCNVGTGHGGGGIAVGANFVGGAGGAGYSPGTGCGTDGGNAGGNGGTGFHGGGGGGGGFISGGAGANANGFPAVSGTLGQGGASYNAPACGTTGGGGGGYYGGGGAAGTNCGAGRGGGGSSWTGTLSSPLFQSGVQTGNGQVIISWAAVSLCPSVRVPVTVTVDPIPSVTASASPAVICAGSSSTLTGGGANTYLWNPGGLAGNPSVSPVATTTYTVTGTSAAGCTATSTTVVTVNANPATPAATVSPASICDGGTALLSAVVAANVTVFTENFANNAQGWTLGTEWQIAPAVGSPLPPTGNADPATDVTPTADNGVAGVVIGGAGTATTAVHAAYYMTSPVIDLSGLSTANLNFQRWLNSDYTPYMNNLIDVWNGVSWVNIWQSGAAPGIFEAAWSSQTYNVTPYINANFQVRFGKAVGAAGAFTVTSWNIDDVTITGTVPAPTVAWTGPAVIANPANLTTNVTPGVSGTLTYTVTATNGNGCTSSATTVLTVNTNPTVTASASPAVICAGGSSTLTGGGAATYAWDPGALVGNPSVSPVATTNYTVTGTDGNGCTGTSTVDVVVNSTPTVTASASPAVICAGGSSTLTGGGAATYAWDPGALVGNPSVSPVATTNYTVTGTDANGCTGTSTVDVVVNTLPTVTASPVTQTVCENGMATISGGGAATYTWTGGITDATPFMVVAAGNYTVTGTDANGCSNTATAEVLMNAAPVITAGATPNTTCDQTTVTPSASGAGTIVWSGGLTNNVPFVAVATTTYTVTGTDGLGCSASTTVLVTVNPMSGILAPATSNQAQDHGDDFDINYYAANCDLIATVDDGAGGNVLGLTTSTVNVDATAGFHNGQPFVRRWYQITPTNNGSADVVLYINQSDFDDYNAAVALPYLPLPTSGNNADPNIGNIRITKNADAGLGNSPVVITPTANWNGTYWELSFNTPSFSQFRVHSVNPGNVPLPATVTSFSGLKLESSDKLSWTTSSEQNNAYFTLQHSTDGTNFTTIAKVNSKAQNGNSATELNYSSIHATPSLGHNYYRLQQTDLDNKLSVHAQIVDLIWGTNGSTVSIYPNPTRDILNIDLYAATAQNTTVKLLDMSGRVIKQIQAKSAVGMNNIKLSMGEIASGVYTVQVYENNQLSHTSKVKKND